MKTFKQMRESAVHRTYRAVAVERGERKPDDLETKNRKPHFAKDYNTKYEVNYQGEKTGTLNTNSAETEVKGTLHGKQLPNISKYAPYTKNPVEKMHAFLRTKEGRKWSKDLSKYDTDINDINKTNS